MEITSNSYLSLFIPQTNGEKAVDIEVTSGQDVNLENDLLEFLLKTMVSAMGVPANLLQMGEEIEFSRSLAMQNSKFLRFIISVQKELNEPFSNIYSRLYKNEFSSNDENFMENKLEIMLPSPATLNYTNLADQINNVQGIIDFITQTIVGEQGGDETKTDAIKRHIAKMYVTGVDWDKLEYDIKTNLGTSIKDELMNGSADEASDSEEDY